MVVPRRIIIAVAVLLWATIAMSRDIVAGERTPVTESKKTATQTQNTQPATKPATTQPADAKTKPVINAAHERGIVTGLVVPRFASLKAGMVNLRVGPGTRYPIRWVLRRKYLPVQIIAEHENWRRIINPEGDIGWVQQSSLSGRRTVFARRNAVLYRKDSISSAAAANIMYGATGQIAECGGAMCKVVFGDIKGYMEKDAMWGVGKDEVFN